MCYEPNKRLYLCFDCRVAVKQPWRYHIDANLNYLPDGPPCPTCRGPMAGGFTTLRTPPKNDKKGWKHIEHLVRVEGWKFRSCYCGSDPCKVRRVREYSKEHTHYRFKEPPFKQKHHTRSPIPQQGELRRGYC